MEISEKMLEFVRDHANDDMHALRLKYSGNKAELLGFNLEFALIQIEARRKARKKLPTYVGNEQFLFPSLISEEQASNEAVARFHASLVSPKSAVLDLTAGLGIDDFEFAKAGMTVTSCEIDTQKCDTLRHNANILGIENNLKVVNCDSIDFLKNLTQKYDMVFADPARRDVAGGRVHALADCQPDIHAAMPEILNKTGRLIVKASPLLDITLIRKTIENLRKIYVVCFRGECKELLIDISPEHRFGGTTVIDLDWEKEISRFEFSATQDSENASISYFSGKHPSELKYLYEPNPGIMKVADWTSLWRAYPALRKCDPNTHIFVSDALYADFPGRVHEIISNPTKKELKALNGAKINIVARNYPLSAPEISKKYNIVSGGTDYLYAFRCKDVAEMVLATPVMQDQG